MTGRAGLARLGLLLASVGAVAGAFEIGLRIAGFSPLHDVYSKPSLLWRHDDLLGWSHEPGASGVYVGPRPFPIEFRAKIRINADGLRGPEIGAKPEGGYRILVLGDSVVAAFEVEENETFVALAQKRLRRRYAAPIEVINGGVRGYGTDQSYLYFTERGHLLDPDLVVFSHSANDPQNNVTLHRLRRPFGKGALRPDEAGALEPIGAPIPRYPICAEVGLDDNLEPVRTDGIGRRSLCGLQIGLADHSALFSFAVTRFNQNPAWIEWLNRRVIGSRARPAHAVSAGFEIPTRGGELASSAVRNRLTARIVRALADEVSAHGASFLWLMSGPEQERRLDRSWPELAELAPVALQGSTWIPSERLKFRNDSHYTALGHEFWADLLVPELERVLAAARPDLASAAPPRRRVRSPFR